MPTLTCYRLSAGTGTVDFDDFVVIPKNEARQEQTITHTGFQAKLYVRPLESKLPPWANFLNESFDRFPIEEGAAPSALLLIKLLGRPTAVSKDHGPYFAIPFGPAGRFLIKGERVVRGYGLRTALNLIYPKGGNSATARLRAVDSKRHGAAVMRARAQASAQVELEAFDVNQFRDLLDRATGTPASDGWGSTISGSDALSLSLELNVKRLGTLCRKLDVAFHKTDYKNGFDWIDNIRNVTNATVVESLESRVLELLKNGSSDLQLAPPEMLEWDKVSEFEYRPDKPEEERVPTSELRLSDYLGELGAKMVASLSVDYLRRARVAAVDTDGHRKKWSVWRCLVGEFTENGKTYLLDEGRFFEVDKKYLAVLDQFVNGLNDDGTQAGPTKVALPDTDSGKAEGDYNRDAASNSEDLLLLDRRDIGVPGSRTTIEICDLLSSSRRLIHVKRHLGSATLSHLFAQGLVSAELLQSRPEFRKRAAAQVKKYVKSDGKQDRFSFFNVSALTPSDFEVVYAIAEEWNGATLAERLPFFSKINLREAATNLKARGFNVTVKQIHAHAIPQAENVMA